MERQNQYRAAQLWCATSGRVISLQQRNGVVPSYHSIEDARFDWVAVEFANDRSIRDNAGGAEQLGVLFHSIRPIDGGSHKKYHEQSHKEATAKTTG